jgi:hypothetical protein
MGILKNPSITTEDYKKLKKEEIEYEERKLSRFK